MQSIPIVISRLTDSGKKQIYTLRDPIYQNMKISERHISDFVTMSNYKQKQNKVRIRRIQSSGSKRKFPKDFFSKQNCKPNKNASARKNKTIQHLAHDTACFATFEKPQEKDQIKQTPKFKAKKQNQNVIELYKNQTLKQAFKSHINKFHKKQQQKTTGKIAPFQATFSEVDFKSYNQQGIVGIQLNAILKPHKQNLPIKRIKATKQNLLKKYSLIKDRNGFSKYKDHKNED